jgi:head-tail adaptor
MHSGLLRSQISIERETLTPDGMGGNTSAWAADPAEGVWANWKGYKGTAQFNSEESHDHRDVALNRFRAVIHFRGDAYGAPYYTEGDRVVYKNRTYNIESILDVEDRQQWLEMTLVEGRPS